MMHDLETQAEGSIMTNTSEQTDVRADTSSADSQMKVADAKRIFQSFGDELEEFYDTVFEKLIADQKSIEIPNSNYLHALQLTSLMLRNTSRDFQMLGGSTTNSFIAILEQEFR